MDETTNVTATEAAEMEEERDDAIYPEGYDPESGEGFFLPETPPLPVPEEKAPAPEALNALEEAAPEISEKPEAGNKEKNAPADFAKDLETLTRLYPDAAKPGEGIPVEVMREYRNGTPLLTAYSAHRAKTDAETIASLRKEVAALRQIQKNQEQAVIRGTTGGSAVKEEPDDPFLRGLREDW